ncbi:hypothetical protein CNR22_21065 [Sphingobacteriaceae bacterium]|nr:hypothetical protein CNR22_21065 [Sphingobacteriaceae bacterium]
MKKSLILILSLSIKFGFAQVTSGLVACYPLNCNATDMTSNALNGTLYNNVTCVPGHLSAPFTALHFGGTASDYVELPADPLFQTNVVSVSGWYQSDDLGQAYLVYTKNNCTSNFEAYALNFLAPGSMGPGTGGFYVSKADGSCSRVQLFQNVTSAHPIPGVGDWTHVVFCIDDNNISLYINGTLNNSVSHSITWDYASPIKSVVLGNTNESNFTQSFLGSIDNLRFYDRCLSASEVEYLYYRDPACDVKKDMETVGLNKYGLGSGLDVLSQNTPNPFNNETTISYLLPASVTNASIDVHDMVGKKIASYPLEMRGESSIKISTTDFPAGIYMYSIVGDGKVMQSRKMIITD